MNEEGLDGYLDGLLDGETRLWSWCYPLLKLMIMRRRRIRMLLLLCCSNKASVFVSSRCVLIPGLIVLTRMHGDV